MDKGKLIRWILANSIYTFEYGFIIKSESIDNAMLNGTFDKQPCDMCGYWENIINNGHNDDIKYCTQCGRKLEEWRKNK